ESDERQESRGHWHETHCGTKGNNVVEVSRIPQGTTQVAAISQRQQTRREGRPSSTTRSARALCQVVRIKGCTVHLVVGVRTHRKLRDICLADGEHARLPQPLHHNRVLRRHLVLENGGATCEGKANGGLKIFEGEG